MDNRYGRLIGGTSTFFVLLLVYLLASYLSESLFRSGQTRLPLQLCFEIMVGGWSMVLLTLVAVRRQLGEVAVGGLVVCGLAAIGAVLWWVVLFRMPGLSV